MWFDLTSHNFMFGLHHLRKTSVGYGMAILTPNSGIEFWGSWGGRAESEIRYFEIFLIFPNFLSTLVFKCLTNNQAPLAKCFLKLISKIPLYLWLIEPMQNCCTVPKHYFCDCTLNPLCSCTQETQFVEHFFFRCRKYIEFKTTRMEYWSV